ncbi:MAG: hypothetical protein GYB65_15115, partial [Chloroflexi bacterium]|nr:hypothetical protein [Chloroflexota bacterium]
KMSEDRGERLTSGLWFFSAVVLATLFISAAAQGELTRGHILLAFAILGLAVAGTVVLLFGQDGNTQNTRQTKAKRNQIDGMLRGMNDQELAALQQRLTSGDFREETVVEHVGDDGELVWRS